MDKTLISVCSRCKVMYGSKPSMTDGYSHGYCRFHELETLIKGNVASQDEIEEYFSLKDKLDRYASALTIAGEFHKHSLLLLHEAITQNHPDIQSHERIVLAAQLTESKTRHIWEEAHR